MIVLFYNVAIHTQVLMFGIEVQINLLFQHSIKTFESVLQNKTLSGELVLDYFIYSTVPGIYVCGNLTNAFVLAT